MVRTQPTQDELAAVLAAELEPLGASRTAGALMLALANQETGSASNMWNWNVGNITTADTSLDYWSPSKGKAKGLKFRAYESLDDGARDYVRFVHRRSKLWDTLGTGDVSQFARQIRDSFYNPDLDIDGAAPVLLSLAKQALPRFASLPAGAPLTLSGSSSGGWGGLIVLGLFLYFASKGSSHGTKRY